MILGVFCWSGGCIGQICVSNASGLFLDTCSESAENKEKVALSSKTSGCSTIELLETHLKVGFIKCEFDLLIITWIVLCFLNTVWFGYLIISSSNSDNFSHEWDGFKSLYNIKAWEIYDRPFCILSNYLIHEYEKQV